MPRLLHRLIFLIFLTIFLVVAPATVLWTAGYRYSFTRQRLEKTGILQLASTPKNATIAINNQVIPNLDTPALIQALLPNTYRVTVSKPGYLAWEKSLTINSNKSTFADQIILIRDSAPTLTIADALTAVAWDQSTTRLAAIADVGEWWELITIDHTGRHLAGRLGKDSFHPRNHHAVTISADGSLAGFIGTDNLDRPVSYLGSAEPAKDGSLRPFRQLTNTTEIRWLENNLALTISNNGLSVVDPETSFTANATSFGKFDDALWDESGVVAIRHESGRIWLVRAKNTLLAFEPILALPTASNYQIVSAQHPYVIVRANSSSQSTLINILTSTQHQLEATTVDWGHDDVQGKILTCTDVEIATVDLANQTRQVITRQAGPLADCHWHPSGHYVFYRTNSTAYLIETDTRDVPVRHTLFSGSHLNGLTIDPKAKTAIFSGTIGQQTGVWRRELE